MGGADPRRLVRQGRGTPGHRLQPRRLTSLTSQDSFDDLPLAEALRREGGRVLATLIRLTGDIDAAEDAVQDAVLAALERWPVTGVPQNPAAWLTTTARNRALDRLRREGRRDDKETAAVRLLDDDDAAVDLTGLRGASAMVDDRLRLLFTCCHPALAAEARVALALRTLCGLSTVEIARVFLVPEATMGQRITRAKRKIAGARIPYRVPADHELPDRLASVLATVYAAFTAGHTASQGRSDERRSVAAEAVRLARLTVELMPDEPECAGLLALLLATHARAATRLNGAGDVVLLANQDRSRWDHGAIAEAASLVEQSLRRHRPGPYQIQAAIAALHSLAPTFADTDWPQLAELYRLLERHQPSDVVRVNRAVAEAEVGGPEVGLALLGGVAGRLDGWHLYWSTRADFLRRLGRTADAAAAYRRALGCPTNDSDRRFLQRRLNEMIG